MKSLHKAFLFIVLLGITIALLSHWHEHRNDNSTYLEQLEYTIACAEWNLHEDSAQAMVCSNCSR